MTIEDTQLFYTIATKRDNIQNIEKLHFYTLWDRGDGPHGQWGNSVQGYGVQGV